MATSFTPAQYRQIYSTLPGPTPDELAAYNQQVAQRNATLAGVPESRRASLEARLPQIQPPQSAEQAKFSDWLGNGGNRLGYDWNGNQTPDTGFDGFMEQYTPSLVAGLAGGAFAPALAGAVGATSGGVAAGAITGATSGAIGAGLTGGNVVKGALTGALGSGLTAGLTPTVGNALGLQGTELGRIAAGGITGAGVGAVKGAITGQGAGAGALLGGTQGALMIAGNPVYQSLIKQGLSPDAARVLVQSGAGAVTGAVTGTGAGAGAIKAGTNAVVGSIFNNGNAATPSPAPQSNNNNMANDFSALDPNFFSGAGGLNNGGVDTGYGSFTGNPGLGGDSGGNFGFDTSGGIDQNYLNQINQQLGSPGGSGPSIPQGGSSSGSGGAATGGGGGVLSSLLARLLPSGTDPKNAQLLTQLLGMGAQGLGGYLNNNAARTAANQYAQYAQYTPTNVSTGGGSATFGPNGITTTNSPGNTQLQTGLTGLGNTALANLGKAPQSAGGYTGVTNPLFAQFQNTQSGMKNYNPQNFSFTAPNQTDPNAVYNDTFKQLQDQSRDSENKFYQNNLDNQFARGVLSSTAGQYQSQAALDSINKQTTQNQLTARDFADRTVGQNLQRNDQAFGQQLGVNQTNNSNNFASVGVNNNNVQQALANALGLFQTGNNANSNSIQQQLARLTTGLSGGSTLEAQQLARASLGNDTSAIRGGINRTAYAPQVNSNSLSGWGDFLTNLGGGTANAGGNSQIIQLLQQVLGSKS